MNLITLRIYIEFYMFLILKNGKQGESAADSDKVPTPVVIIDQDSDPDATVLEVTFGDRLGALLDTVMALSFFLLICWLLSHSFLLPFPLFFPRVLTVS